MKYLILFLSFFLFTVTCNAQKERRRSSEVTSKDAHKSQGSSEYRRHSDDDFRSKITYPDADGTFKEQHYGGSSDMREVPTEKEKAKAKVKEKGKEKKGNTNETEQQRSNSKRRETEHHTNEVEADGSVWM